MFRANPGTWERGAFWERTYARNRLDLNKIAETRSEQSLERSTN